uniref:Histone deacetylase 2 n=1 Tax=Ganoderma boninense TaxID=34458 RepID=A0A5K1K6L3_9APHY|nr:Histone deacetylase 2 [Ganoderma boninense]
MEANPVLLWQATRARSAPIQHPFTPSLLADPPAHSTALSKRKRNAHNRSSSHTALDSIAKDPSSGSFVVTEATPNPKPRKQTKRGSPSRRSTELDEPATPTRATSLRSESPSKRTFLLSPHHANPNADYIPPLPTISRQTISSRRRSATPKPPYEPPRDQFTPPREIIHTPPRATVSPERMSKSSKRKSTTAKKHKKLVLTIKKEPPEIDLSAPPPPPSPSDDPLLLKGLPRPPRPSRLSTGTNAEALDTPSSTHARRTPAIASSSVSPPGVVRVSRLPDLGSAMDLTMENDDDDLDDSFANAPPLFDLTNAQEDPGVWDDVDSGTDSEDFDQTGEYTGRFKVLTVPTKADPPSSCTRSRQDAWGNPSSPFPGSTGKRRSLPSSSSPPLKAVSDGEEGTQSESLDEDDVFFLDTPVDGDVEVTVREEFQEGSSRDTIDGLAGLDADLSMHDIPQADFDTSQEQDLSQERSYGSQDQSHEKSPSPLPIVHEQEQELEDEHDSTEPHEPHVRFAASRDSLQDVSMEIDDEDDSQDSAPLDADLSYESILHDPDEDEEEEEGEEEEPPVAEVPHDSDSSDEETVDRELSREPGQFSDDEDDEEHDTRPKPPAVPTPPRAAYTPARSISPNGQSTRPKGFLSITSPLRRQKSPQTQSFQVRDASPLPSIDSVFVTPAPARSRDVDHDEDIPQAFGSGSRLEPETQGRDETAAGMEDDQPEELVATDVEDGSGDESEELDDGVVKITSDDPRVAARAAAILKMVGYYRRSFAPILISS